MDDEPIAGVYVSLNVPPTGALLEWQELVCGQYALVARSELHMTIGYLGAVAPSVVGELGSCLAREVAASLWCLHISGLGGALAINDSVQPICRTDIGVCYDHPRVMWFSIRPSDELIGLRGSLLRAAGSAGIDCGRLGGPYYPHVTIGSAGPPGEDWSGWDVHTVAKTPTLESAQRPIHVYCDKAHLTSSACHPDSVYVLKEFCPGISLAISERSV